MTTETTTSGIEEFAEHARSDEAREFLAANPEGAVVWYLDMENEDGPRIAATIGEDGEVKFTPYDFTPTIEHSDIAEVAADPVVIEPHEARVNRDRGPEYEDFDAAVLWAAEIASACDLRVRFDVVKFNEQTDKPWACVVGVTDEPVTPHA